MGLKLSSTMLKTLFKKNFIFFSCLLFVANCNSYDCDKGLNSDKSFNFENKCQNKLDDLLNYEGDCDSDFSKNDEKFEDLLDSIGFDNEDEFDANFNPWSDLDENHYSNRPDYNSDEYNDGIDWRYRTAFKNFKKKYPVMSRDLGKDFILEILKSDVSELIKYNNL